MLQCNINRLTSQVQHNIYGADSPGSLGDPHHHRGLKRPKETEYGSRQDRPRREVGHRGV